MNIKLPDLFNQKRVVFAFLLIAICLVYGESINAPFHYDDERVIIKNESIRTLDLQKIFNSNPFRFILDISFAINYRLGGLTTWGYRIVNILIHALNAIFLYLLILKLQTHLLNEYKIEQSHMPAFLVSVFFALSPLVTESVTYISSRSEILCAFFILPSFYYFISYLEKGSILHLAGSLFFYICAGATKERGALLFFLLIVFICSVTGQKKIKRNILSLVPFLLLICAYFIYRAYITGGGLYTGFSRDAYSHFLLQAEASLKNMRTVVLPVNLSVFYWFFIPGSFFEFNVWGNIFLVIAAIFFSIIITPEKKWVVFFWLWYFIFLSPNIFLPFQDAMADRWLYLPSVGIYGIVSVFFCLLLQERKFVKTVVVLTVFTAVCLMCLTVDRNGMWQSGINLWGDTAKKSPFSPRTHNNYGVALATAGRTEDAIREFQLSLEINNWYSPAWSNLAKAYRNIGDEKGMLKATSSLINCGEYYIKKKMYKEAVMSYNSALEYVPDSISAMGNLATIYIIIGDYELARKYLKKLLENAPDNKAAREMLTTIGG